MKRLVVLGGGESGVGTAILGKKENFAVVFLNAQNKLIHYEIISKGTINATVVFPRELAEYE